MTATATFPEISFSGELRPSQSDVTRIAREQLGKGERRLHIVAPPGSGKTVLGLYLWAECVRTPVLVLSPNSAIQSQWAARTSLFEMPGARSDFVSTDPKSPALLTSLTYQSVTLPRRGDAETDEAATDLWIERLLETEHAHDPDEALRWIEDLRSHNLNYYKQRLSIYRKRIRDEATIHGDAFETLHSSSRKALERLRDVGVGMLIFDECHHLLGHWGRVLAAVQEFLDEPVIVGLTATPPDKKGHREEDVKRYAEFFGEIDYEVPVPAVVKDGFLAPYQDLAWFVRPTTEELAFVASTDKHMDALVEELCTPHETEAVDAASGAAKQYGLDDSTAYDQHSGEPESTAILSSTAAKKSSEDVDHQGEAPRAEPLPEWLATILAQRRLPTGPVRSWSAFERRDPDFALSARIFLQQRGIELPEDVPEPDFLDELPTMGVLVPVLDRYIRHRLRRSPNTRDHELAERAIERLRMLGIQVTETGCQPCASPVGRVMAYSLAKAEALVTLLGHEMKFLGDSLRAVVVCDYEKTSAVTADISHLLDAEAGGAIAAFRAIVGNEDTDALDAVLITGSSVLVDNDLLDKLRIAAEEWLNENDYKVTLVFRERPGFYEVNGEGSDWCPRVYVEMITELFQRGVTRCLVGTRGLLGEGWDANKINVLIDMTTVTTSMTVNQLRGRSIRLDPAVPDKIANNWDIVCIAPEFTKGLDDYSRFIRKHRTVFGVTDDGAIEKGVGHVHAAFTELRPEGLEESVTALNADMLERAARRLHARGLWKIGEPYNATPKRAVEMRPIRPDNKDKLPPFQEFKSPWSSKSLAMAIGEAILASLFDAKIIEGAWGVHATDRDGGYVRVYLENAPGEDGALFAEAVHEAFAPLRRPRYVIPRYVDERVKTILSRVLPGFVGRFFQKRKQSMAMLHMVPGVLAKRRELVEIYEGHWNRLVSPGEAVYALQGRGEEMVENARRTGLAPPGWVHEKEVFL